MSKFSGPSNVIRSGRHPISTTGRSVTNHEGSRSWELDPKAELFLLGAVNMVGEDTFYESAAVRDARFVDLIHWVTKEDPDWILGKFRPAGIRTSDGFAKYLRGELKMRSASIVVACEYVWAGGAFGRQVINAVCQRPDEPAEILGYWLSKHGRQIPQPIKRGVADAVCRLYTERNVIKWDSGRKAISFADVIELVHPKPRDVNQGQLFKYLLDQAHHGDGREGELELISRDKGLLGLPEVARRPHLRHHGLESTWSWERLAGWLPGGMDAEAWAAVIPNMGVMALIRNLRNFDGACITEGAIDTVIDQITDVDQVVKSRVFPYQVWSAYREAPSDNWKRALGRTLDYATTNTPELPGRTLVLIDTSGSMQAPVSGRSTIARVEVAAVMGAAMAKRNADRVDLGIFAQGTGLVQLVRGWATLDVVRTVVDSIGVVGHATYLNNAIRQLWDEHDRVVVFTDDQAQDNHVDVSDVPRIYTFDLGGYGRSSKENGKGGRFLFGGFSDSALAAIPVLENSGHAGWPF